MEYTLEEGVNRTIEFGEKSKTKPVIFGVCGYPNSGKSHFLITLREELEGIGKEIGFTGKWEDYEGSLRYINYFDYFGLEMQPQEVQKAEDIIKKYLGKGIDLFVLINNLAVDPTLKEDIPYSENKSFLEISNNYKDFSFLQKFL